MTRLLIAGASVRAAIASARRSSNYQLLAADMFNDRDLCSQCQSSRIDSRYTNLMNIVARERPEFWMYTGALENHPEVIAEVGHYARLLGNDAAIVKRIRQPSEFATALTGSNLPCPKWRTDVCPPHGRWLRKPLRSAAGIGIRNANPGETSKRGSVYFQRFVPGTSCSAVFVAQRGEVRLLGTTQQLSGNATFGATGFQYCGSIGPLPLSTDYKQQWERIGECLASSFGLQGLFGIDAIVDDYQVVPVEINPRYTASIEVLEAGQSWSSINLHRAACLGEEVDDVRCQESPTSYFGKAILFAQRKAIVTDAALDDLANCPTDGAYLADIPQGKLSLAAGQPILTVLAQSGHIDTVLPVLRQRAADVLARLINRPEG